MATAILNESPSAYFSKMQTDFEFAAALASAYNDWQIAHWLDKDGRFRGSVRASSHTCPRWPHARSTASPSIRTSSRSSCP